jgi:DNA-binding HxlR family transcriptional regulator
MTTMTFIGGKWKPVVVWYLQDKALRFSELERRMPSVSQKVLTQQLRELEGDGILKRKVFPVVPPHVEYSLTEFGRTLVPVVHAICEWGYEHGGWRPSAAKRDAGDGDEVAACTETSEGQPEPVPTVVAR